MGNAIRSAPLWVFVIMVAFPLAMAGVAMAAGAHARRRSRLIEAEPLSFLATAEPGYRRFEGRVEAIDGDTREAPLTKSPCVWYQARVEKAVFSSDTYTRSSGSWGTVRELESETPFFIRDDGGRALVEPYGAEITPTDRSVWYGSTEDPEDRNPARVPPTENPKGMVEIMNRSTHQYRYSEARIYAGDPLFVVGTLVHARPAADEPDEDDEPISEEDRAASTPEDLLGDRLREKAAATTRARVFKGDARPLIISTTPSERHVALLDQGSHATWFLVMVFLALAGLLVWVRIG